MFGFKTLIYDQMLHKLYEKMIIHYMYYKLIYIHIYIYYKVKLKIVLEISSLNLVYVLLKYISNLLRMFYFYYIYIYDSISK